MTFIVVPDVKIVFLPNRGEVVADSFVNHLFAHPFTISYSSIEGKRRNNEGITKVKRAKEELPWIGSEDGLRIDGDGVATQVFLFIGEGTVAVGSTTMEAETGMRRIGYNVVGV